MAGITYIPYDPQADPRQYLAQALQQGVSGFLGHRQRQQFQKGLSPTLEPMQLLRHALSSGMPMNEAIGMARMQSQIEANTALAKWRVEKPTLSGARLKRIEKKLAADPNFEGSPEHLRLLGVSGAKTETPEEKLKRLQALRKSAAGQYYGIEGGNLQPLFPKVFEYAEKELAKLPMFAEEEQVDISPVETDIWPLVPPEVGQRIQQAVKEGYKKEEILKWLKDNGYNDYAGNP